MTESAHYAVRAGQRMRAVREQRDLSLKQVEIASRGRFPATTVQSWESARRGVKVEQLAEYAQWLGVDILLLLPPELGADSLLEATARRAARNAVADVTESFRTVSPEKAREMVTAALEDLGGTAA